MFDRFAWTGKEHVLDIGCGDGRITRFLSNYVPYGDVLAIDGSPSMIHYARQNHASSKLQFELSEVTDSLFYEKFPSYFDLIVSFHCLHWVDNQLVVLLGIKKCLKPGGRAFIRLTSKGWDPIQENADALIRSEKWNPHFITFKDPVHRFNTEEYLCLIREAGLNSIQIEEVYEDDTFHDRLLLAKQIKSWLPHLKHLPKTLQGVFLDDLIDQYLLHVPPEDNGTIHLYDCYLEIEIEAPLG